MEHQIIRDHETNRSRGFGFIIFDSEEVVDEMLSKGNMIDMSGTQVSLLKWRPRSNSANRFRFMFGFEDGILHFFKFSSMHVIDCPYSCLLIR